MSADDGYIVAKLKDEDAYGIFHYFASTPDLPGDYDRNRAMQVRKSPILAILHAHKVQAESPTEYGVHVKSTIIDAAESEYLRKL